MSLRRKNIVVEKPQVKKVVIVIGSSGTGKSTIINLLFNSVSGSIKVDLASCVMPCKVDSTTDSVTKKPQWLYNATEGILYGDTVGLGDPKKSNLQVARDLKCFVQSVRGNVNCIIVVLKFGRLTAEERLNLDFISKLFDSNWTNGCIVVATHYGGRFEEDAQKQAIKEWFGQEVALADFFGKIRGGIVLADNSLGDDFEADGEVRRQCVIKLQEFISTCQAAIGPMPTSLHELIMYYMERYFSAILKVRDASRHVAEMLRNLQLKDGIGAGICPLCDKEIVDLESLAHTDCHHHFHFDCLARNIREMYQPCPICGKLVSTIYLLQYNM